MLHCRRCTSLLVAATLIVVAFVALPSQAGAQGIGITNGFPYTSSVADTAISPYFPSLPAGPAGQHGFLKNDGAGNWIFADGTPARFYGVTLQWNACFPDSTTAVITAARLRKLGVNLVRFQYMDNAYDWGDYGQKRTFLDAATGFTTLHAGQIARLDWFINQLKQRGIYSYFILNSAHAPRASDGLGQEADSTMWLGHELGYLYPAARNVSKNTARMLLWHVNPITSIAYKDDPAIAMVEAVDQGSLLSMYRNGYTEFRDGQYGFSWRHSRRLDSLFAGFLKRKYGTTAALTAAWRTPPPNGGFPNLIQEGSFEGEYDRYWTIQFGSVNVTPILTQGDSVPAGTLAMKLRVRQSTGTADLYNAYMLQPVQGLEFNTLYRLSFRAKTTVAGGWLVRFGANEATGTGMGAGLGGDITVGTYWKQYTIDFLVPIKTTVPINVVMWFGSANGDLLMDDIQIRKVDAPGLVNNESLEAFNVGRVPMAQTGIAAAVSSKRIEDQSEFYLGLERDYFSEMRRYLHDTVGAKQQFTGAGHYWASGFQEAMVQGSSDFTFSSKGWDYVSNDGRRWDIRDYSPLRRGPYDDGATITALALGAHDKQPFIASYYQPFPNRYQDEGLLWLPAYSSLQDWDGVMFEIYADDSLSSNSAIDSAMFNPVAKNPIVTALMPAASYLYRNRYVSPATNTLTIQHNELQARIFPRMYAAWYDPAVPGGFYGRVMLDDKLVIDSTNATYFTQASDIAYPAPVAGQEESDTHEILWEYSRGALSIDAPMVQATTGYLSRSGAITLRNMDVKLLSGNETATVIWEALDSTARLGAAGRSFLVLATRTEPTGWNWTDSAHADHWGSGPMLIDPMRLRLTVKPDDSSNVLTLQPLDASCAPIGEPMRFVIQNGKIEATIDQSVTHALWYGVRLSFDPAAGVAEQRDAARLIAQPSVINDRSYITFTCDADSRNARVEVFDALGRMVRLLHDGPAEAGRHTVRFDAGGLPAGAYVVRLRADGGIVATTKATIIR